MLKLRLIFKDSNLQTAEAHPSLDKFMIIELQLIRELIINCLCLVTHFDKHNIIIESGRIIFLAVPKTFQVFISAETKFNEVIIKIQPFKVISNK